MKGNRILKTAACLYYRAWFVSARAVGSFVKTTHPRKPVCCACPWARGLQEVRLDRWLDHIFPGSSLRVTVRLKTSCRAETDSVTQYA